MSDHVERKLDRWLKWAVVIGPMASGILFGAAGYVGGYVSAHQDIQAIASRTNLLEGWKDRQEAFNQQTVAAIARLKALMKDTP